jgi:hypothetical protein
MRGAGFACCDRCASLPAGNSPAASDPADSVSPAGSAVGAMAGFAAGSVPAGAVATAGAVAGLYADAARVARRRLLKAAVFPPQAESVPGGRQADGDDLAFGDARSQSAGFADVLQLPRTVWGTIQDISPHVLVLGEGDRVQRFALTPDAVAWCGTQLEPASLVHGDQAIVRLSPYGRNVADRIWANIGRVTGIISERSGNELLVSEGATRKTQVIALQPRSLGRIQVRFPTLEPGYLVDIIGIRKRDELIGMIPATSQPAYPAQRLPAPPLVSGHLPDSITGSATWHEPRDEPPGILGVFYPALDPETACAEDLAGGLRQGYSRMPYLAIGSVLHVRNDCTGSTCLMPVTGCAPIGRLFNDRCVTCGTSPRGRVADLTPASFIALGGELERGCFNATITIGR